VSVGERDYNGEIPGATQLTKMVGILCLLGSGWLDHKMKEFRKIKYLDFRLRHLEWQCAEGCKCSREILK